MKSLTEKQEELCESLHSTQDTEGDLQEEDGTDRLPDISSDTESILDLSENCEWISNRHKVHKIPSSDNYLKKQLSWTIKEMQSQ